MRLFLITILTMLFSASLFAQYTEEASNLPPCSSPLVRYSKLPVRCQSSGNIDTSRPFDLPAERLNIEDIRSLFEAAESSGGGRPRPRTTTDEEEQQQQQETTTSMEIGFNFELKCELKMVNDTDLTILLLSTYSLELSNQVTNGIIYSSDWNHFLSSSRSFEPSSMIAIPKGADVSSSDVYIGLSSDEYLSPDNSNVNLELCASNINGRDRCLLTGFDKDQASINEMISFTDVYGVKKSFELNCSIKSRD